MNIIISARARDYIQKIIAKEQGKGFRLSIKKTGCSGYSYAPSVVQKINPRDVVEIQDNVTLYIDFAWLHVLEDLIIDYVEEDKSGLKQKKLVFQNTKESSRCGCGESFHIERG